MSESKTKGFKWYNPSDWKLLAVTTPITIIVLCIDCSILLSFR